MLNKNVTPNVIDDLNAQSNSNIQFANKIYFTDNLVVQVDTIFVSGMNPDLNEEDIADHFGSIGIIKVILFIYLSHYLYYANCTLCLNFIYSRTILKIRYIICQNPIL